MQIPPEQNKIFGKIFLLHSWDLKFNDKTFTKYLEGTKKHAIYMYLKSLSGIFFVYIQAPLLFKVDLL